MNKEKQADASSPIKISAQCSPLGKDGYVKTPIEIQIIESSSNGLSFTCQIEPSSVGCHICGTSIKIETTCDNISCSYRALKEVFLKGGWVIIELPQSISEYDGQRSVFGKITGSKMNENERKYHFKVQFEKRKSAKAIQTKIKKMWFENNLIEVTKLYKNVEGFLLDEEAKVLFELGCNRSVEGSVVEIGSWKGKSCVIFAYGAKMNQLGKIVAVDPHTGSPEHGKVWTFTVFEKNIKTAQVEDYVVPIVKTSEEGSKDWKGPIRLLWIDGNHDYEHASSDYLHWEPFLEPGGTVAFHDTVLAPGVKRAVKEHIFFSSKFKNIRYVGTIISAEKLRHASFLNRVSNLYSWILWELYCVYSKKVIRIPEFIKTPLKKIFKKKIIQSS